MLTFKIILYFTIIFNLSLCLPTKNKANLNFDKYSNDKPIRDKRSTVETKPKVTLDEFFDYTTFSHLSFSSTGQHLLFQTTRPSWNTSSYGNDLWIYDIQTQNKTLITNNLNPYVTSCWSPSGSYVALLKYEKLIANDSYSQYHIYLYSVDSNEITSIPIGKSLPSVLVWSHNDSFIYFVTNELVQLNNTSNNPYNSTNEFKKTQQQVKTNTIFRIDIIWNNDTLSTTKNIIRVVPFSISELLYVPYEEKLIFTGLSYIFAGTPNIDIYSLDLNNLSSLTRLTHNKIPEKHLQLSTDGKNVLFTVFVLLDEDNNSATQTLYSLNLTNKQVSRFAEDFDGNIVKYIPKLDGGVYILGQWKTNVHIYSQQSPTEDEVYHPGFQGTYRSIAASSNPNCSLAFVHSSTEWPMEVYCVDDINNLLLAKQITNENKLFTERNLPQTQIYNWTNQDDHRVIEGILHYPPEQFRWKNLPLLVLIHGGPTSASLNELYPNCINWALLAASHGWLVLEPNYRGSTGYGEEFRSELRGRPLSLAGKDILSGVDQLIKDRIVNPYELAVGGCSFGGSLTNWLITQTKRFNAALSCSGQVEHVSSWGLTDAHEFYKYLFNGLPWETPHIYQNEAPIYQLDRVRTPTLISTGEKDTRVSPSQSYILQRGLYSRGINVKLLVFPNEGHTLYNPWNSKMKIQEELKWLEKYGRYKN
ncbi:unnamed protein product [Adineta steineri]|uniref:Peptidase S9 prolyl oligopeptidase catalytic domain-containing protein n=1 Tax=Adineta steineri TaxID=433720 RepID=A0A818YWZ0_9BILA|nr:unnamed protein product [Adineta steineri]CAF3760692.1 unnamed protein product [Adineta steineri]